MKFIGWDPGRMYDKIYSINEGTVNKALSINALCTGYERRIIEDENDINETLNYLDVDIFEENNHLGSFFIGNMAYKYNRDDLIITSNNIKKFSDEIMQYEKIRMVTHIAYVNFLSSNTDINTKVAVGTGVPTEEYFDKNNNLVEFEKEVCKRYTVKFNHKLFNGFESTFTIDSLGFTPEGTATAVTTKIEIDKDLNLIENKNIQDELADEYLVLNLGSSTGDGALIKNGKFDSKGFFGLEIGSSTVIKHIINDVSTKHEYKPDKTTMDMLLMHTEHIRYKGDVINIKEIAKPRYQNIINQIRVALLNELDLRNLKYKNLNGVYLSGGLTKTLKDVNYKALENLLPIKVIISEDPIYDESKGYLINTIADYNAKQAASENIINVESIVVDDKKIIEVS